MTIRSTFIVWCALMVLSLPCRAVQAQVPTGEDLPEPVAPALDLESAASPQRFKGLTVKSVEIVLNGPYRLRDLSQVVVVTEGQPLLLRDVSRSIELIYRLGAIEDVLAEADPVPGGVHIRFRVWPATLVRRVIFRGNLLIGNQALREQLTLRPGSVYSYTDAKQQAANLARFYSNEGFLKARVTPEMRRAGRAQMDVTFRIDEGPQVRIREIHFHGNTLYSPRQLQQISGLDEGSRFRLSKLEDARKAIHEYLRDERHLGAKVRSSHEVDSSREWVTLRFDVDEGPKIYLEFFRVRPPAAGPFGGYVWHKIYERLPWAKEEGTPRRVGWYRRRQFLEVLDLDSEQQFSSGFSLEAAERLESWQVEEGFNGPKVTSTRVASPDGSRETFRFVIDPGKKIPIQEVLVEGNQFLSTKVVRETFDEAMERFAPGGIYTEEAVEQAVPLVADYYRSQGFLDVRLSRQIKLVETPLGHRARIRLRVEEGVRTLVRDIQITGNAAIAELELRPLLALVRGEPYDEARVRQSVERIRQLYQSRGYMNAQVFRTWKVSKDKPTDVTVTLEIDEGSQARFGEILVRGARRTRPRVINRELTIKTGEIYSPDKIEESKRRLNETGLFDKASIYPVEEERVRDMMVEVHERKPKVIALSGGVLLNGFDFSLDAARFDASLEATHYNLWGRGHRLSGKLELASSYLPSIDAHVPGTPWVPDYLVSVAEDVQSYLARATSRRVVLSYQAPYLFGLRLKPTATATLFEREVQPRYLMDRSSAGGSISGTIGSKLNASFQLRATVREPDNFETDPMVQMWNVDREQRAFLIGNGVLVYDRRDSRIDPTKGFLLGLQAELGQGFGCGRTWKGLFDTCEADDGSAIMPEAQEMYLRVSTSGSALVPIFPWLRGEARIQAGYIQPFRTDNGAVPIERRFYLGGAGTVRGYSQDSLGPVRFRDKDLPSQLVYGGTVVPTGGNATVSYTLELQMPFSVFAKGWESWELAVFHDAGNVFWTGASRAWFERLLEEDPVLNDPDMDPSCASLNSAGLRYSAGLGIRYRSGIGPIRLDVGFPLNRQCEERWIAGHLSIGLF